MTIHILGNVDKDRLYCTGSFSKFLTTFVILSFLSERYDLQHVIDDANFLDSLCHQNPQAKSFLQLFQQIVGGAFSIRDICSYYTGLPYTFNLSDTELMSVEAGQSFKHHAIPNEEMFLNRCKQNITPVYPLRAKFHYSEVSIIFLGYFIEKAFNLNIESLYEKYLIGKFKLSRSVFSRKRAPGVYIQDLSMKYDYPSIAILDHGYFCYSNGFFTTLNDAKILLEQLLNEPAFLAMTDINHARAASNRIMNGMAVEIRQVQDDVIFGYEGLSYSGCNIWAYSTKHKEGFVTTCDSEEDAYTIIYEDQWGYKEFDKVPAHTQTIYQEYLKSNPATAIKKDFPLDYQGEYHRVKINDSELPDKFAIGKDYIVIRNPDEVRYNAVFTGTNYAVEGADHLPNIIINLYEATSKNRYMLFDGTLYIKHK